MFVGNNRVGLGADGNTVVPNGSGGIILDGAEQETNYSIGNNFIAGNGGAGISTTAGSFRVHNISIFKNRIGLTASGARAANASGGILIGGNDNSISGNNIYYGSNGDGVSVDASFYPGYPDGGPHGYRNQILDNAITGDASHQLRTPLTAMLGQAEVALRHDRDPAEYRRVLESVRGRRSSRASICSTRAASEMRRTRPRVVRRGRPGRSATWWSVTGRHSPARRASTRTCRSRRSAT